MKIYDKRLFDAKRYLPIIAIMILPLLSYAQSPAPRPVTNRTPQPVSLPEQGERIQKYRDYRDQQILREEMRQRKIRYSAAMRTITELYRKPTEEELLKLTPDKDLLEKYSAFLKQEDTGLIKLIENNGCAESTAVVSATDNCLKYTLPGAGSSYSFRTENYRILSLADLHFSGDLFSTQGNWLHGVLADIGDISLQSIDKKTPGLKHIESFHPAFEYETAKKIDYNLKHGIRSNNFDHSRSVAVRENNTYLLRSIAYRGVVSKVVNGYIYNELDYDKRKDVIIAFRVIRKSNDGSVTILWKKIASKESPKITLRNGQTKSTVKDNDFIADNSQ